MKALLIFLLAAGLSFFTGCSPTVSQSQYASHVDQDVSFDIFYTSLSPYGRWMDYSPYGYVWLPAVPVGFSPYVSEGHWVYTRFGWTWYSYYAWGWAPFHYGRWHFDPLYGWMWLPDSVWGPAWVVWRHGAGYSGWAPLGFGMTVQVVVGVRPQIPHERWIFVRDDDFPRRNIDRYRVDRSRNNELMESAEIHRRTREDRGAEYFPGPDASDIEQATRRRVSEVAVEERSSPGRTRLSDDRLHIYRPEVQGTPEGEERHAPEHIYRPEEIRELSEQEMRNRPDVRREPETTRPPDARRASDARRQPQQTRPPETTREPRRPSRTTNVKKRTTDDDRPQRTSDKNRRN